MKILAITQKTNNQRFQQNQGISPLNQTPKYDSVSFGIRKPKLNLLEPELQEKLRLLRTKFLGLLRTGSGEAAVYKFSQDAYKADRKSTDLLKALVLSEDAQGNSFCKLALDKGQPSLAECMVDLAKCLDEHSQQYFVLSANQKGDSLMKTVLEKSGTHEYFEHMAIHFLEFAAQVAPRFVIKQEIPEVLSKRGDFSAVSRAIANNSRELTKSKRLAFLEKYNQDGVNDRLIAWVNRQR